MSNFWNDAIGTAKSFFKLGFAGVRLKNNAGNLAVRNSGDTADADISAANGSFTGNVTGTWAGGAIPIAKGGTGQTAVGAALQVLRTNAGATATEWAAAPSGSPGGSNNQFQYNNSGAFGGSSALTLLGANDISFGSNTAALALAATSGFPWVPYTNGVPTATTLTNTNAGHAAIVMNRLDSNFYSYNDIDGAWNRVGAVTPPAGVNTNVQYNNNGAFGATTGFNFDPAVGLSIPTGLELTAKGVAYSTLLNFEIAFQLQSGVNGVYTISESANLKYNIVSANFKTDAGTISAAVAIGGTNVTGLAALSLTSTTGSATATAANTVTTGSRVTITLSAAASAQNCIITLKCTRIP